MLLHLLSNRPDLDQAHLPSRPSTSSREAMTVHEVPSGLLRTKRDPPLAHSPCHPCLLLSLPNPAELPMRFPTLPLETHLAGLDLDTLAQEEPQRESRSERSGKSSLGRTSLPKTVRVVPP